MQFILPNTFVIYEILYFLFKIYKYENKLKALSEVCHEKAAKKQVCVLC